VAVAFVVFRAPSMHVAGSLFAGMAGLHGVESGGALRSLLTSGFALEVVGLLAFVNLAPNTWQVRVRPQVRFGLLLGGAAAWSFLLLATPHPFIYYQF
jgi:hypothetical protein